MMMKKKIATTPIIIKNYNYKLLEMIFYKFQTELSVPTYQ